MAEELSNLLRVPLRLTDEIEAGIVAGSQDALEEVRNQIRSTLMQIFIRRLILTFERRLNDNWNLKASELMSESWVEIQSLLLDRMDDALSRREERFLGESGEIARDLDANWEQMENALEDPSALMRLLMVMTQGRVITFDDRTHRRKMKQTMRLTYVFLAAHQLEDEPLDEIQSEILSHLETAQVKLCEVWGQLEFDRIYNAGHTLADLSENWQKRLSERLSEESFNRMAHQPLNQLSKADRARLVDVLGGFTQNQLYRQLLLSKISELWVEYLTKVEALRVSVRMEAYGQRDPLVEYKGQASTMFSELLSDIRAGVIDRMFRTRLVSGEALKKLQESRQKAAAASSSSTSEEHQKKKKGRKRH
jgi:preprotein translocase subunit SecA